MPPRRRAGRRACRERHRAGPPEGRPSIRNGRVAPYGTGQRRFPSRSRRCSAGLRASTGIRRCGSGLEPLAVLLDLVVEVRELRRVGASGGEELPYTAGAVPTARGGFAHARATQAT